jgi:hypothetical protein
MFPQAAVVAAQALLAELLLEMVVTEFNLPFQVLLLITQAVVVAVVMVLLLLQAVLAAAELVEKTAMEQTAQSILVAVLVALVLLVQTE